MLKIGDRVLNRGDFPFVIAEVGVNHENDLEIADEMIRQASRAGADAVKFQTYKAERLAVAASPAYWSESTSQRDFFKKYDKFGEQEYRHLAETAKRENITFLSTPFDKEAVDFLDPLVPAFKVASADITNIDLLRHIAKKGKPVLLSTGASTLSEIARAVEILNDEGVEQIALLHCILHYPAEHAEVNLRSIPYLSKCFPNCIIGYSDHTKPDRGMALLTAASLLGSTIIEKHFTLDKTKPGNDHYHAMDPDDLALLVGNLRILWGALGDEGRPLMGGECAARTYARRSVVAAQSIPAGTRLEYRHLTCKRPCTGIPAELIDFVIGRRVRSGIEADTILSWDVIE